MDQLDRHVTTCEAPAVPHQTERWKDLVAQLHLWAGGRCQGTRLVRLEGSRDHEQRCRETTSLHAHHVFYDRLGHEDPADLRLLCVRCHLVAHLLSVACPRCGVTAVEDWEAWDLLDGMDADDLAHVDVFAHVFDDAQYEIEHWPFCAECYDLISQEGADA